MEYKILNTSRGVRYMKGAKFCSVKDIPEDVLQKLHTQDKVDTSRDCIFCGQPGTEEKTLNTIRRYLCLTDYQERSTGELAQAVNYRLNNANG